MRLGSFGAAILTAGLAAACGGDAPNVFGDGAGGASTGSTTSGSGAGSTSSGSTTTGSGGGGGQACPGGCDDGVGCTIDACEAGACTHAIGTCPQDQFCDPLAGCIDAPICADDAPCLAEWGGDACKTNVHCNQATAKCTFDPLDNDGDGHLPLVCGGDDCNDATAAVQPGQAETCDGLDNDCDGTTDEQAACPGLLTCQAGSCVCPAANACGAACVDKSSDPLHCGACFNACPPGASCVSGACDCPGTLSLCGGACVDLLTDPNNCGQCGNPCLGGTCNQGQCLACTPGAIYVMADRSGSMYNDWPYLAQAINTVASEPASVGLSMGLMLYPTNPASCVAGAYPAQVPIGLLPGNAGAIAAALAPVNPVASSTVVAPLEASINVAKGWANATGKKAAVVLFNDGFGTVGTCANNTPFNANTTASNGFSGFPSVPTYVIGLGPAPTQTDLTAWNDIAASGGANDVWAPTAAEILSALRAVRDAMMCP